MSFQLPGLKIEITSSSLVGSLILLVVFTLLALATLPVTFIGALLWGVVATLLYWISETLHQYGHYMAGRRVGYAMTGVRLWWFWGASVYPVDEPTLPASVHIQRALGGAPVSIAIGLVAGVLALLIKDSLDAPLWGLLALFAAINFFYFGLGAFLPLGFTDGSTLLYYRNKP
jgi:hypothetical protein